MDIQRAKQEIINTVRAYLAKDARGEYVIPAVRQRPVLLMGPPGIGKTQIMEQVARECGIALVAYTITHHTRQSAVGLPFIRQRSYGGRTVSVTEYTMSEIIASVYEKMEATGLSEGILFIDEINCVSETLAPTMLQFLQGKTFGNQKVPAGWVIAAAGNPPEYNKSVRDFDIVTLDRVKRMDIEPDYPAFKAYARAAGLHPAILAYLELHPDHFYQIQADVDGTQFVTARGWEDLSNLLQTYDALGLAADETVIREYLQHREIAEDFAAYLDLYKKYRDDYGVADILAGRAKPALFARAGAAAFDERLALVSLLLAGLAAGFAAADSAAALADGAYAFLKDYKKRLDAAALQLAILPGAPAPAAAPAAAENAAAPAVLTPGSDSPLAVFTALTEENKADLAHRQTADLLDKPALDARRALLDTLNDWARLLAAAPAADPDAALALLKDAFRTLAEARARKEADASAALEHAFDFLEGAFAAGQEMTVFVTELTLSPAAQRFLAQNPCPRYFSYNKSLLLDSRRAALSAELARDANKF